MHIHLCAIFSQPPLVAQRTVLSHTGAITGKRDEFVILQYIQNLSPTSLLCHLGRLPHKNQSQSMF
jgi:hypothetical protein